MSATTIRRAFLTSLLAVLFSMGAVNTARAQGFVSPFIGYDFGGTTGCQGVLNCEDKHTNWGVAFGAVGSIVGFEEEFAYANDFFGSSANQSSTVITLMSNFMIAPKIGPIQPYVLGGIGLIRTTLNVAGATDQNQIGWDVGGGVTGYFSQHVGVRGDIRYFHSFQVLDLLNLPIPPPGLNIGNTKLDFGRASIGVVFKF
jgi:opacity protein-like surface antigen